MANIIVKDLSNCTENGSFIRDLSEAELDLQGGGIFKVIKSIAKAIVGIFKVVDIVGGFFVGGGGGGGRNENTHIV
jgi:hypothetical protein